ncbi:unnamed protein product [marine sediment metagenome]|uniref:TnsA endonuclease N-terminal domain-containing protein n=1 Tax=marine sediment metagenome TaxID=412755 RepID=X1APX4_9ZZZZ
MARRRKRYKQGRFIPRHPEKYIGNVKSIRYLSSWELRFDQFLDNNPNVLQWSSEEIAIPYIKPTDGKVHRYYPDYWIKFKDKHGKEVQEIVEIKPDAQTRQPTRQGKKRRQQLYETITYAINMAKWKYAKLFCDKHGVKFRIVTERELFK